eukprot:SAG11_NODE_3172_length_2635_cov_2.232650_3_plen_115_part_00
MKVGKQVRHYHIGTPMGEPGSCAKANGLCLDDELRVDAEREAAWGGGYSERNCSLAFVDDKHVRVAYDDIPWTQDSAEEYVTALKQYSDPLTMIDGPRMETTEFFGNNAAQPNG